MFDWVSDSLHWVLDMLPFDAPDGGGRPRRGRVAIPDVTGTTVSEARTVLAREGFGIEIDQIEDHPAPVMGLVVSQRPTAGTRLRQGKRVTISVLHPPAG